MRHSKLVLLVIFSIAAILMVGCADNEPKKRGRINTSGSTRTSTMGKGGGDLNAAQFKAGADVPATENQQLAEQQIDQILKDVTQGATLIPLEKIPQGKYQLTEVINVIRRKNTPNPQNVQNKTAAVQGVDLVEGHSLKIEIDQNGAIKLQPLNPFGTKEKATNTRGYAFNIAVQMEMLPNDLKVKTAIAYISQVENGKRTTKAIDGDLERDHLVAEIKAVLKKYNEKLGYYQLNNGTQSYQVHLKGDVLILAKDTVRQEGAKQVILSSLHVYKKIAAPEAQASGTADGGSQSATTTAKDQGAAAAKANGPTTGAAAQTNSAATGNSNAVTHTTGAQTTNANQTEKSKAEAGAGDTKPADEDPVVTPIKN